MKSVPQPRRDMPRLGYPRMSTRPRPDHSVLPHRSLPGFLHHLTNHLPSPGAARAGVPSSFHSISGWAYFFSWHQPVPPTPTPPVRLPPALQSPPTQRERRRQALYWIS